MCELVSPRYFISWQHVTMASKTGIVPYLLVKEWSIIHTDRANFGQSVPMIPLEVIALEISTLYHMFFALNICMTTIFPALKGLGKPLMSLVLIARD